ncbi:MAG: hypothetical protein ACTSO9_13415 [Candidatus Helarchaeota archaeon]
MWKDWLNWQIGVVRAIDQNAKIMISFGSWLDYHEPIPPTGIDEINGTQELITMDINFDIVGIEYHYGTLQNGSINELENAITQLEQAAIGKSIFLWEVYYPGLNNSYNSNWSWSFPPAGGYNDTWQADMLRETLRIAYQDPKIVGFNMFHLLERNITDLDPSEYETGMRCYAGLINATGHPKQAYYSVRDYWNSLSSNSLSLSENQKREIALNRIILFNDISTIGIIIFFGLANLFGVGLNLFFRNRKLDLNS